MKKHTLKSILCCLLACALSAACLTGCGGVHGQNDVIHEASSDNAEQVSITFFGFKADAMNLTATETAMQSFMDVHRNVKITYEGIKGTEYWDAFDKRDASGVLDDVVMMHHDHLIPLSAAGKLADLSDLPGIENYTDAARSQFTNADGSVYFLPTSISTYNLYINYDLLEAHGQSVPENWAQFQQVCDYFVSKGIVPIIANNRNSLPSLAISRGLFGLYQKPEAEIVAELDSFNSDSSLLAAELAPGVEQVADMLARGWFDPEEVLATGQTSDDLELFAKGERPFMVSGGWASTREMALGPDFTYGVHPYPILDDGCVLSVQVDTCISINARSPHVKEAKEFVAHLIEPDMMWEFCDTQASYTPLKDSRPMSEQTLTPSIDYLTNGRVAFRSEYRMELPMETAMQGAVGVLLGGGTVEEAQQALVRELAR